MRRALLSRRALLAAGASLALPVRARAQTSAQLVEEVDRFRAVMPNLAANVALRRGDAALRHLRVARREEGLELLEPRESAALWTGAEPAEDMSARLIAAFCACGPLERVPQRADGGLLPGGLHRHSRTRNGPSL